MSALRAILDRLNDLEATIAQVERTAGAEPSLGLRLSLQSLESRREMLREELANAQITLRDAEIERLRSALERTRPHVRDDIIEECARVAEERYRGNIAPALLDDVLAEIAAAIRALKDKP